MVSTIAAVIVLSLLAKSSSQECGCCGLAQQLIANNDEVNLEISTNPLLQDDPKVDRMIVEISESNEEPWCSMTPPSGTAFNPYLTFKLNSLYLIEVVSISGDPGSGGRYVSTLTIQNNTGQGFAFISDNSGIPQELDTSLTNNNDVRNISFMDKPVLATSLQIKAYTWAGGFPCMRIELYGCLYNSSQDSPSDIASNNTVATNNNTESFDSTIIILVGIWAAIFGALIAITTILAVRVIVYCCKKARSADASVRIDSVTSNEAYGLVDKYNIELQANECYKPVAPPAEQASASQHEDLEYIYPTVLPTTAEH